MLDEKNRQKSIILKMIEEVREEKDNVEDLGLEFFQDFTNS